MIMHLKIRIVSVFKTGMDKLKKIKNHLAIITRFAFQN
jgi:hypothetical protein